MRVAQITTAFSNGEISPELLGRVDIEQRKRCAFKLENFLVRPYGNIRNMTGSRYIATVKDSSKDCRLLDFTYSQTQAYVLETGDAYFRYYTDDGQVQDGSSPLETVTPYLEADIWDIQYAQLGDVMYLVHPLYSPRKLVRSGATSWALTEIDFVTQPFMNENTTAVTLTPSGTSGSVTIEASSATFVSTDVGGTWQHVSGTTTGTFKITAFTDTTHVTATIIDTVVASASDKWSKAAWSDTNGYPSTITFHENRLILCGTSAEPIRGWASDIGVYDEFSIEGLEDDDGFDFDIPTKEYNKILWVTSGEGLSIGTSGGEFLLSSGSDSLLTPSNRNAKQQSAIGSESGLARSFGSYTYYVQKTGRKLQEFFYSWEANQYKSNDMTILAEHITESGIKDISLQKNQDSIMFCVLNNGKIAAFTREITQNVIAWSRLVVDGDYKSIRSIPRQGGGNDDNYIIIEREIDGSTVKYVELFEQFNKYDITEAKFLDSCLTYDGYEATAGITLTFSALTGTGITATASGAIFTSAMVGRTIKVIGENHAILGRAKITAYTSSTVVTVSIIIDMPSLIISAEAWGVGVKTLSGLDHLEGESVSVLTDGAYNEKTYTVESGSITLLVDYVYITVGKLKESTLDTVPISEGSQLGTAISKMSRTPYVAIMVDHTQGITIGDENFQREVFQRNAQTTLGQPEPLQTTIERVSTGNQWSADEGIRLKQPTPLQCNVLALVQYTDTEEL